MVNFSEMLETQLVPEWKHAFCDYEQLKKDLDNIKAQQPKFSFRNDGTPSPISPGFQAPSFRQIGSIARRMSGRLRNAAVKVHVRHPDMEDQHDELYETELLVGPVHGEMANDKVFFARLDGELNKVNKFYKTKEQEFYEKAEEIKLQLVKLKKMKKLFKAQEDILVAESSSGKGQENNDPDLQMVSVELSSIAEQNGSAQEGSVQDGSVQDGAVHEWAVQEEGSVHESIGGNRRRKARDLGLIIPQDTPSLLVGALKQKVFDDITQEPTDGDFANNSYTKFDRKRLLYAERTLRDACVELYRGLTFLKSFSTLNMTAFSKILKKYDKNTGRDASVVYLKVVEQAYFHSSDRVLKMMDGLEKKFTEVFANGDHKKAMAMLRQMRQTASHRVTFFLGFFTGGSLACLVAFFVLLYLIWIRGNIDTTVHQEQQLYLNAIYPVFSILALMLLHLGLFGWNLYNWRQKRINYAFIFGLSPWAEIKYRELLLIASGLATLVSVTLLGHFVIYTNVTASLKTAIMPFSVLLIVVLILICPFNIIYQPSRFFFLTNLKHLFLAPFYKVAMADFFVGDQLTSQVYMFRNIEYVLCYSLFGRFEEENIDNCTGDHWQYLTMAYVVSMVPYWWRFAQCLRRWIDEGHDVEHVKNGIKYFSALVAAGVALTYHYHKTTLWLVIFVIVMAVVAAYQLYWDIYKDWGLLRTNSKNFLLRDALILDHKQIYFASIALNALLRFAWLQSVTQYNFFGIDRHFSDWFFASLEIVRRVQWNFYRLENEHLNNVGKFRATKAIPLPFSNDDDEASM